MLLQLQTLQTGQQQAAAQQTGAAAASHSPATVAAAAAAQQTGTDSHPSTTPHRSTYNNHTGKALSRGCY